MGVVLIIEDDPSHAKLFSHALASQGYECVVARGGDEGTLLAAQVEPTAILIDIRLPDRDGRRIIYDLRAVERLSATPIIAMSAYGDAIMPEECVAAGADAFLRKPVPLTALFAEMRRSQEA